MRSTIDISTRLTRHSETGNTSTSFSYVEGVPPMLVIKQKNGTGSTQVVELTLEETEVFHYILGQTEHICRIVKMLESPQ